MSAYIIQFITDQSNELGRVIVVHTRGNQHVAVTAAKHSNEVSQCVVFAAMTREQFEHLHTSP